MHRCYMILLLTSALAEKVCSDTNYRLNVPIKPKSYAIAITPYFDTGDDNAFTFDGEVSITFNTETPTTQIKLHSHDLTFNYSNIYLNGPALSAENPLEFVKNYSFAIVNLQEDLNVSTDYTLKISYRGPIRKDLTGFYRNYYIENGVKKWLGATQMEPTHARKVFPCFDEPALKATFTLTIDRLESFQPSLANTKLRAVQALPNGYVREIFHPTPVMSTYLVAFLVSEFKGVHKTNGSKEFGVFTRPDALNQTDYAVDIGQRVVNALGDFFGIDYYSTDENLKLDHVALTDFNAGAMENWGLIKYREALLLYVPEVSAPTFRYRVAQIVAHETTHMWFGNLVTCHWWSDTWLNEGFANYFQDYITALIEPEVGSADILVTGSVYSAYTEDEDPAAPAISNDKVNSPAEISGHFGTITYQKAGSVIRMMHHLMGDEAFRIGLNTYLEKNKFSAGYPNKMYEALDIGVRSNNALSAYPNTNITEIMSSWITQPGHPVLHVVINYDDDTVVLTQKRFFSNPKNSGNEIYSIPITFTTGRSPNFSNTKPAFIMSNESYTLKIANISQDHPWVMFNIQETGFYRVNYDEHGWELITRALTNNEEKKKIHRLNRVKIVNDIFAFFHADLAKFERVKNVLEFLRDEEDYAVWTITVANLRSLWNKYLGSDALADIQAYILSVLESPIEKMGYDVKSTDDLQSLRQRAEILELACKLDHQGCIEHAVKLFKALKTNGTEISPSLRIVAYSTGLRFGNGEDFTFLWNRMKSTNVANEAQIIGQTLGHTSDESSLRRYLRSMTEENSPIRIQDLTVPLSSVLTNYSNLHIVMDELKHNFTLWASIFPTMDTVLSTVGGALHTEQDFTEFEAFLSSCSECTVQAKEAAKKSLQRARDVTSWAKDHQQDILANLRNHSFVVAPSIILIIALIVILGTVQFGV